MAPAIRSTTGFPAALPPKPADKAGDLNLVFEAISQQILLEVEAWRVTDPMGPDIVFTSEDVSTTDPRYDEVL